VGSIAIRKHFCLGAALAWLEAEVVLNILLERVVGLRLDLALPSYLEGHKLRSSPMLAICWEKTML
jgi:cytochrome P450